jgi:hypothetical protein
VLLWSLPSALGADFAAAFLETGLGARGPGMGGAFAAAVDDASAPYWNPAGLVRTRGSQGLASLMPLSLDRRQSSASFTLNVRGELAFGFAWLHAGVDDIEGRTGGGDYTGKIEDTENAFYVAVGRALGSRLAVGFTMKAFEQRIDVPSWEKASASGHGFDMGLQFRLSRQIYLAAAARNLGAALDWRVNRGSQQTSSTEDELPRVLVIGLACYPSAPVLLAADLYQTDDTFVNLGAEWTANPLLILRGGLNRVPGDGSAVGSLAVGLSLRPMRSEFLHLSYSYASDPVGAGDRNLFGFALKF